MGDAGQCKGRTRTIRERNAETLIACMPCWNFSSASLTSCASSASVAEEGPAVSSADVSAMHGNEAGGSLCKIQIVCKTWRSSKFDCFLTAFTVASLLAAQLQTSYPTSIQSPSMQSIAADSCFAKEVRVAGSRSPLPDGLRVGSSGQC